MKVLKTLAWIGEYGQYISLTVLFVGYLIAIDENGLEEFLAGEIRKDLLLIAAFFWATWMVHTILYVNQIAICKKHNVDVIK